MALLTPRSPDCTGGGADLAKTCALPSPTISSSPPIGLPSPFSPNTNPTKFLSEPTKLELCEPPLKRRRLTDPKTDDIWASIETELENDNTVPRILLQACEGDTEQPCEAENIVPVELAYDDFVVPACLERRNSFFPSTSDLGDLVSQCEFDREETSDDQVCFGMIDDCLFTMEKCRISQAKPSTSSVKLANHCSIVSCEDDMRIGTIHETMAQALQALQGKSCELQLECHVNLNQQLTSGRKTSAQPSPTYHITLSAVIYGPAGILDEVGDFLDSYQIYLQDPKRCDRNVRYRNPQKLSGRDPDAPMTIEQEMETSAFRCEILERSSNYLSDLESRLDLPPTPGPSFLRTPLYPHQQQALSFMLRRERGWAFTSNQLDVWKALGHDRFLNTINDEEQAGSPPDFRGGILADDMGLGKSLSMISLIASDRDPATLERMPLQTSVSQTTDSIRCTLLVVPSSLVQTWETQLGRHLRSDSLKWFKHHGKQKVRHRDDVEDVDIVITTYETLSSEWGKRTTWISPVFSIYWHRLVLDEAHYIKDRTRQTAQAIFTLHADRRWAMTGTPVQNRLSDLASLFKFLRVHPYDNPERFNEDITRLWVNHAEAEAINRAKRLFHFIGIRRSNDTIELPKRTDKLYRLEFSSAERQLYESLRVDTIETLEGCTSSKTPPRTRFLNVLHRFNTLRMICNLGTNQSFTSKDLGEWNSKSASEAFAALAVYGQPLICKKCGISLDGFTLESQNAETSEILHVSQCGTLVCRSCIQEYDTAGHDSTSWCGCNPSCRYAEVEHTSPDPTQSNLQCRQSTVSTKIRSLVTDIEQNLTEKSVVFSFWTSTLDLVETALVASHIRVARVDGRVSENKRKHELDSFRSNSSISVILLTISCGAVGLDLTAASRAYIMEPHWNPTVEEQALARIHRLGQKREVTTIRFVMNGTCEDHVRKVQDRKTLMADVLLSTKKASGTNKGPGRLDILRSLLN